MSPLYVLVQALSLEPKAQRRTYNGSSCPCCVGLSLFRARSPCACSPCCCRLAGSIACGRESAPRQQARRHRRSPGLPDEDQRPKVVVLGDSLTAGLGLLETQSYPSLLQQKIDADGFEFEVVNAGVSGDTSAGGLRRLDWALAGRRARADRGARRERRTARAVGRRDEAEPRRDHRDARGHGTSLVILAGMEAPPNYGAEYASSFRRAYREVAHRVPRAVHSVPARQGRRRGVAQPGRRHPSERRRARRIVADTVWPSSSRCSIAVRLMIELRGVSKTVPSGSRHAHDPAPARSARFRTARSWRSPARPAAASRRCSG